MTYKENQNKAIHWDSDGQQLMVDNGASASITPYLNDFITPLQPIKARLKVSEDIEISTSYIYIYFVSLSLR